MKVLQHLGSKSMESTMLPHKTRIPKRTKVILATVGMVRQMVSRPQRVTIGAANQVLDLLLVRLKSLMPNNESVGGGGGSVSCKFTDLEMR